jgi:hypothetical protein
MTETAIPLVRRGRRNARYTAISNDLIDLPTLGPEARIALIYLLTKPDDWQLQINDIRRLLGAGGKPCGRNKAYEVIKSLKDAAYVVAIEELRHGRFFRLTYYVFDEPVADLRDSKPTCAPERSPVRVFCHLTPVYRVPINGKWSKNIRVPDFGKRSCRRFPESGIPKKGLLHRKSICDRQREAGVLIVRTRWPEQQSGTLRSAAQL